MPWTPSGDLGLGLVRAQQPVNVKAYGAKGDGVTNDTTAIANAYAARAGRPLYFPAGRYKVTAFPALVNNDVIMGDGYTLSEIVYDGTGTLIALVNKQDISFRGIGLYVTGATVTAMSMSNCFHMNMEHFRIRGNHSGTNHPTYQNSVGLDLFNNTGNLRANNCMFNNLGIGTRISCIQNEFVNCKWTTNRISVLGTGNNDNSGIVAIGCEFISDPNVESTFVHVQVDGKANDWEFYGCWLEGSTYGAIIGAAGVGGPSSLKWFGGKIGARTVGIQWNYCRQPTLIGCEFNQDQGTTMTEMVFNTVGGVKGAETIEGVAINLVTTIRQDFDVTDFPQYWTVLRRGNTHVGNLKSSSNVDVAGAISASSLKLTYGMSAGAMLSSDAAGNIVAVPAGKGSRFSQEVIINGGALKDGYNDNIGGVLVDAPILLQHVAFRIADPAKLVTGGTLTIQWYTGTTTTLESELITTTTVAVGEHDKVFTLATPLAVTINTVLRAKVTLGTAVVDGPCHVQFRGVYA